MSRVEKLIYARNRRFVGVLCQQVLLLCGIDIPAEVVIGQDLLVNHRAQGVVIHPRTVIGDRVVLFHQVTIGNADGYVRQPESAMERIVVGDDVVLFAGAKVLAGRGVTELGRGSVVGANAVLTQSTGEWEVWAGNPARKVGHRDPAVADDLRMTRRH